MNMLLGFIKGNLKKVITFGLCAVIAAGIGLTPTPAKAIVGPKFATINGVAVGTEIRVRRGSFINITGEGLNAYNYRMKYVSSSYTLPLTVEGSDYNNVVFYIPENAPMGHFNIQNYQNNFVWAQTPVVVVP